MDDLCCFSNGWAKSAAQYRAGLKDPKTFLGYMSRAEGLDAAWAAALAGDRAELAKVADWLTAAAADAEAWAAVDVADCAAFEARVEAITGGLDRESVRELAAREEQLTSMHQTMRVEGDRLEIDFGGHLLVWRAGDAKWAVAYPDPSDDGPGSGYGRHTDE